MNGANRRILTPIEVTAILIGILVDVSSANLPNSVVDVTKQNGWISAALGVVYPLYIFIIAAFISKKFPDDNILMLSKKYFGNVIGNILNFIFFLGFFNYLPPVIVNALDILRTYVISFMSPLKIYIVLMMIGGYTAYKGIKVLGRITVLNMVMIMAISVVSVAILKYGTILNLMPIGDLKIKDIAKSIPESSYYYGGMEIIFLIYPLINNKKKLNSAMLKAIGFTCCFYTWVTFITIYCLGVDIIPKTIWSFFNATESIRIEVMHTFRYIYIFLWILIVLKSIAIFYYACMFILSDIHKAAGKKQGYIILGIVVIFMAMKFYKERWQKDIISQHTTRLSIIFNLIYITVIAVLIFIKKDGKGAIK